MMMKNIGLLPTITLACSLIAMTTTCLLAILLVKTRAAAGRALARAAQLEDELIRMSRDLDAVSQRAADQSRRLAWIETRVRSRSVEAEPAIESATPTTSKPNITERRHRVLSLARRGQDAGTIAATLGLPHGEVELMINLSRAA